MIRNLLILGFAACLTGVSQAVREIGYKNAANENLDAYYDYDGLRKMDYANYDSKRNDAPSQLLIMPASNQTSESDKAAEAQSPAAKATEAQSPTANSTKAPTPLANAAESESPLSNGTNGIDTVESSPNGTSAKLAFPFKVHPASKKSVQIQYFLYDKDKNEFSLNSVPRLRNKDTYFLIHGFLEHEKFNYNQEEYISHFFYSIFTANLEDCNCNIVGVKWRAMKPPRPHPDDKIRSAITVGRKMAKVIDNLRSRGVLKKSVTVIGHDLGNVAAAALAANVKKQIDFIFGLDQRQLHGVYRDFYLRQDSARLVQTITTRGMKYNYGHRNFYPNGGNLSAVYEEDDQCYACYSFILLGEGMTINRLSHFSTFCSSYEDFRSNKCEHFPKVSYFNKILSHELPPGNYFVTEPEFEPEWQRESYAR